MENNANCGRIMGSKQNFREAKDDKKLSLEILDSEEKHLTLTEEVISRSSSSSVINSLSPKFDQPHTLKNSVYDVVDTSVLPPPPTNKTGTAQMPTVNHMNGTKLPVSVEDLVAEHSD